MNVAVLLLLLGMMSCAVAFAAFLVIKNKNKTPPSGTPPKTPPKTPPGTPPKTPPSGTVPAGTGGGGAGRNLKNEDELFAQVKANFEELKAHLQKNYASHPKTKWLLQNFRVLKKMPNVGMRKSWWGVTIGGSVEIKVDDGFWRRLPSVNSTLVHELGHVITHSQPEREVHGPNFATNYMWLANIASNDLGWQVEPQCNSCQMYRICDSSVCPKCKWCGQRRVKYSDSLLGN